MNLINVINDYLPENYQKFCDAYRISHLYYGNGMENYFYMRFICNKFQGNRTWIDCFIAIFEVCKMNNRSLIKKKKQTIFFETLLAHISGMLGI